MSGEVKTCPHCEQVKGFGPFMERHIFRCGKGIPLTHGKKPQPEPEKTRAAS